MIGDIPFAERYFEVEKRIFYQYNVLDHLLDLSKGYSTNRELNKIRAELLVLEDELEKAIEGDYVEEKLDEIEYRLDEISESLYKAYEELCEEIKRKYEWLR